MVVFVLLQPSVLLIVFITILITFFAHPCLEVVVTLRGYFDQCHNFFSQFLGNWHNFMILVNLVLLAAH